MFGKPSPNICMCAGQRLFMLDVLILIAYIGITQFDRGKVRENYVRNGSY